MEEKHVDKVLKIQRKCYEPCYREAKQSYLERIRIFSAGNASLFVPEVSPLSSSPSTLPSTTSPASTKRRKKKRSNSFSNVWLYSCSTIFTWYD